MRKNRESEVANGEFLTDGGQEFAAAGIKSPRAGAILN